MELKNLIDASNLLKTKSVELLSHPDVIWNIVWHAKKHIDRQINEYLGRA